MVLYLKTGITFFFIMLFLLREMFKTKAIVKIKTHILCSVTFFPESLTVCEIMWKNTVEPERPQVTIRAHALCLLDNVQNM